MDKKSFFAGLRVGLALGRTGRDADGTQDGAIRGSRPRLSTKSTVSNDLNVKGDSRPPQRADKFGFG